MIKLFTNNDLDGVSCAILAGITLNNVEIEYCTYQNVDDRIRRFLKNGIQKYDSVIITDLCINEETANMINHFNKGGDTIRLMDHRISECVSKYKWATIQEKNYDGEKTCSVELLYEELIRHSIVAPMESLNHFVELVRLYDNWEWENADIGKESKQLNEMFMLLGRKEFVEWCRNKLFSIDFPNFSQKDKILLDQYNKKLNSYIDEKDNGMVFRKLLGLPCGIVFAGQMVDDLGNSLCKRHPEILFVCMIDLNKQMVYFRSISNKINLGEMIGTILGGTGSYRAVDATFPDIKSKIIQTIFGNALNL